MPPRALRLNFLDESSTVVSRQMSMRSRHWAEAFGILCAVIAGVLIVRRLYQAMQTSKKKKETVANANLQLSSCESHMSLESDGSGSISVDICDDVGHISPHDLVPPSLRGEALMF